MTQCGKHVLTVWVDVDVGIGRVVGNSLIRIENKRPFADSALNVGECVGPFRPHQPGLGIEAKGISPFPAEGLKVPLRRDFVASGKGSGRRESPNTFQTIAHQPPGRSSLATFVKARSLVSQWNAVALRPRSKLASCNETSSNGTRTTVRALSGIVSRRRVARRPSGPTVGNGLAASFSNRRVAVPVPAPILNVIALGARPHRPHRKSNTQSGYAGRAAS